MRLRDTPWQSFAVWLAIQDRPSCLSDVRKPARRSRFEPLNTHFGGFPPLYAPPYRLSHRDFSVRFAFLTQLTRPARPILSSRPDCTGPEPTVWIETLVRAKVGESHVAQTHRIVGSSLGAGDAVGNARPCPRHAGHAVVRACQPEEYSPSYGILAPASTRYSFAPWRLGVRSILGAATR